MSGHNPHAYVLTPVDHVHWLAEVFRLGVSAEQVAARWPALRADALHGGDAVRVYSTMPQPDRATISVWLETTRHRWQACGGTQTGASECRDCGAWAMHRRPVFGCPTAGALHNGKEY